VLFRVPADRVLVRLTKMTDTERDALLKRVKQLERINKELNAVARRWRQLATAGTVVLLLLFLLTAGVLTWREREVRTEADYLRMKLDNQREQRDFSGSGSVGLAGREVE
jgi:hypothetical protein